MTTVTIENLFCYENAYIDLSVGPVLVTGKNSSGKTSFANILGCLAAHEANPAGLAVSSAKAYIRDGAVEGGASMGAIEWRPPAGIVSAPGEKPTAPPHAVGLVNFLGGRTKADRAKLWEGMFLPSDPEEVLAPRWQALNLSPQQLTAVLNVIRDDGWDAAQKIYTGQRLAKRRRWEEITGERYGNKKAAEWTPEHWHPDLDGKSEDDMRTAVTEAQDAVRAVTVRQAVTQDQIDRAVHARDVLAPQVRAKIEELEEDRKKQNLLDDIHQAEIEESQVLERYRNARSKRADARNKAMALKRRIEKVTVEEPILCPHCSGPLSVGHGSVEVFSPRDTDALTKELKGLRKPYEAAIKAEREAGEIHAEANKKWRALVDANSEISSKISKLNGQLSVHEREAKGADRKVSEMTGEAERSAAERERDNALQNMRAWQKNKDAQEAKDGYIELDEIVKLLSPTGARSEVMAKHMGAVRKGLQAITTWSGWKPITLTMQYEVTTGGRPVQLAAFNERQKCQWALQMVCGMITKGCQWIVLDAADTLRDDSWDGLVTVVEKLAALRPEMTIVVCATSTVAPDGWQCVEID